MTKARHRLFSTGCALSIVRRTVCVCVSRFGKALGCARIVFSFLLFFFFFLSKSAWQKFVEILIFNLWRLIYRARKGRRSSRCALLRSERAKCDAFVEKRNEIHREIRVHRRREDRQNRGAFIFRSSGRVRIRWPAVQKSSLSLSLSVSFPLSSRALSLSLFFRETFSRGNDLCSIKSDDGVAHLTREK